MRIPRRTCVVLACIAVTALAVTAWAQQAPTADSLQALADAQRRAKSNEAVGVIQLLVAPMVMISACGLLCVALYARLSVIVGRARGFNKERLDAHQTLLRFKDTTVDAKICTEMEERIRSLDGQVAQILHRASHVRSAIGCILTTMMCMLVSSLALGASLFAPEASYVALAFFIAGVVFAGLAIQFAMRELFRALDPVMTEGAHVHVLADT